MFKGRPYLRVGTKRPEVLVLIKALKHYGLLEGTERIYYFGPVVDGAVRSFQESRDLVSDGIVGPVTWKALLEDDAWLEGTEMERAMSLSGTFELGYLRNVYGAIIHDIGDNAGVNYGVLQWNKYSIETLLRLSGEDDMIRGWKSWLHNGNYKKVWGPLSTWMDSARGIRGQNSFYQSLWTWALNQARLWGWDKDPLFYRGVTLLVDFRIQNGSVRIKDSKRSQLHDLLPRYQDDIKESLDLEVSRIEEAIDTVQGNIMPEDYLKIWEYLEVTEVPRQMELLVWLRSLASSRRWHKDVLYRKMAVARGKGRVHGIHVDLPDDYRL